ncbi:MAG: hypothetical protein AAFO17_14735 [Pseudomonadota bacterium]
MIGIGGVAILALGFSTWKRPRLTGALVWAFVASFFVSATYNMVGPGNFADRVFLTGFFSLFIWVGFQFWIYWDPSKWRVVGILIGITALSVATILLSDPPI